LFDIHHSSLDLVAAVGLHRGEIMQKHIFKEFDGYERIVEEIDYSRRYGMNYAVETDTADPYIRRLHPARVQLRVADIIEETPTAKTFRLVAEDRYLPPFLAGQYIALSLEMGPVRTSRPYSISSPPNQTGYYDLTVRRVAPGLVSNYLMDQVQRGDRLEGSGPAGHFYHNPIFHDPVMVCLAGGSGITPFMSMIQEIVDCALDRTVYLFYGNTRVEDAVFHERLTKLSERSETIHYVPVIENPPPAFKGAQGLITGELIKGTLGDPAGKTFYICGPQAMYDFCIPELERLGIPRRKIRREVYGPPLHITECAGWPAHVKSDALFDVHLKGRASVKALAGEPLMTSFEKAGYAIPSLCRSGECSLCRIKVLSGKVFQPAEASLRRSDRRFGYVHACVSYPLEDLEVMIG
jgi:ferredoxin-NADP reductase/ferredoxin